MTISIRSVEKTFGRYPALNGVSLEIQDGELLALLGPSGSGKTTLLRVIAGLDFPSGGQVLFEDEDVTYAGAADRRVGFVFQQYALFRHMNVARNISYGLDVRRGRDRPDKTEIARRVEDLLRLVELEGLGKRYPAQLSGGQRQRVALARALAVEPRVLLLDEPFGALDATVRKSLRKELRRIHDVTGVTTIFVTHDQEEALELADRVAILNLGQIEQVGTPDEVHDAPASPFVTGFVGESNRFEGVVAGGQFRSGSLELPSNGVAQGGAVAFVRPHQFLVGDEGMPLKVARVVVQGPVGRIEGHTENRQHVDVSLSRAEAQRIEEGATVKVRATAAHIFAAT